MSRNKRVLLQTCYLLLIYSVLRLLFFAINRQIFEHSPSLDIVLACLNGIRYDLAAVALLNLGLYLLFYLPIFPGKTKLLVTLSALINGAAFSFNVFDLEYFRFTGKRMTADNFLLARDIGDQTTQIMLYYWYYSLLIIALFAGIAWFSHRNFKSPEKSNWIVSVAILALLGLGIRGGWQAKPLIPANAFAFNPALGSLVLNSTFTLLKSTDKAAVVELREMNWEVVKATIDLQHQEKKEPLPESWPTPKNVLVVILESFGSEYVVPPPGKPSYTPFINELSKRGSFFSNAYANGRRSIDALPAIFAGIPEWMEPPFITSPYQTNKIIGAPEVFATKGFSTTFFHGGNNGTMFFDVMAKRLGFENYVGADQYPDAKDYDGKWGIFDEPFLQFVAKSLTQETKPFFSAIFTLSSHHPYTIPPEHTGKFPKGSLEIHESIGYSDYALRKFYETAQKEPWFKDTLFVFTADHTSKQEYPENDTIPGRFHVPILFIMNDKPLNFTPDQLRNPAQHADIAATLMDLGRIALPAKSHFGESLCRIDRPGIILFESEGYHLVGKNQGLSWWTDGRTQGFPLLSPLATPSSDAERKEIYTRYLKANAHYYNNGMVRNQLIW